MPYIFMQIRLLTILMEMRLVINVKYWPYYGMIYVTIYSCQMNFFSIIMLRVFLVPSYYYGCEYILAQATFFRLLVLPHLHRMESVIRVKGAMLTSNSECIGSCPFDSLRLFFLACQWYQWREKSRGKFTARVRNFILKPWELCTIFQLYTFLSLAFDWSAESTNHVAWKENSILLLTRTCEHWNCWWL